MLNLLVEWVRPFRPLSHEKETEDYYTILDSTANSQPIRFASNGLNESKKYQEERWKNLGGEIIIN